MNKTAATLVFLMGIAISGMTTVAWAYDKFLPRTEAGMIVQQISEIKYTVDKIYDLLLKRR